MDEWIDGCLVCDLPRFLPGFVLLDSGIQGSGETTIPGTAGIVGAIDGF